MKELPSIIAGILSVVFLIAGIVYIIFSGYYTLSQLIMPLLAILFSLLAIYLRKDRTKLSVGVGLAWVTLICLPFLLIAYYGWFVVMIVAFLLFGTPTHG